MRWRDIAPLINRFAAPMRKDGLPLARGGLPMTDANGCGCCGSGSGSGPGPTIDGCGCAPQKAAYQYAISTTGIVTGNFFASVEGSIPRRSIKHASGSPNGTTVVTYQGTVPGPAFCFAGWCYWMGTIDLRMSLFGCFGGDTWSNFSNDGRIYLLMDDGLSAFVIVQCTSQFTFVAGDPDPSHRYTALGMYFSGAADFHSVPDPITGIRYLTDCHSTHTAANIFTCTVAADCNALCDTEPSSYIGPFPNCFFGPVNNVAKNGTAVITPL